MEVYNENGQRTIEVSEEKRCAISGESLLNTKVCPMKMFDPEGQTCAYVLCKYFISQKNKK